MRRIYICILALLALSVACQRIDEPENSPVNQPAELPTGAIGSKATITFSTADLTGPETRGVLNPEIDDPTLNIKTLHLIVFDKNGMLVEICEATELGASDHDDHAGGKHYTVTLTITDEPRIIHYVANCPVDQVVYGHETSIIGNMFVDRNGSEGAKTDYEVSYWARIEVPYILVEEKEEVQGDGTKKIVVSLVEEIRGKFIHVPLLRNYAEITVTDDTDDTFYFEGFTVYNLLDRGTVAPYNSNRQEFQSFFEYTKEGVISNYLYPKMTSYYEYEGHALTSAQLITDFIRNDDGTVKIYKSGDPFYVYERKVSVMTDEEEKWRESPPHIIIKGRYNNGDPVDPDNSPVYYYKMDLVYTEKDALGNDEIKYYNILRNFSYQFYLKQVHDEGYTSLDLAVAGAAGNNISGSSSTSKLTNVSDKEGRLWVSHTDTTLVSKDNVILRYKYIPNYYDSKGTDYQQVDNDLVRIENIVGDVITGIVVADNDISGGTWDGYREVTISVNSPEDIILQQILSLKTDNTHLNRQIRYTLRQKLTMEVECTPKVSGSILQPVTVDIKLPVGMTEDMFPLVLNMETYNRTLSPDATKNTIPVTAGTSIIDEDGRREEQSYYYTVTIPTLDDYKELPNDGNKKVYSTYWRTNKAANASTFYVDNKYFNQASDSWQNYTYEFSNASCTSSALGEGQNVTISFTMAAGAINKEVTISLEGMKYTGTQGTVNPDGTVTFTPTSQNVSLSDFKTTTDTDPVSFTLDADGYNICGPVEGARLTYKFDGEFVDVTSLETEADIEVDFTFNISEDAFEALKSLYPDAGDAGVPMFVTLSRMHPADDQLVYSQARTEGDRYIYRIKQAGKQAIKLATTEVVGGPCTVTLQADCFDTQTVTIQQTDIEAEFNSWVDTYNPSITNDTRDFVVVGEKVYYYINVKADPTSVTISDGSSNYNATRTSSEGVGDNVSTTYRIEWSKNEKGVYPMSATIVVAGETYNIDLGNMTVYGLTRGNSTTSLTNGTFYLWSNSSYSSTYMTSEGNNNNLAANTSMNYYNLFTVDGNYIVSVARNQGLKCTNNNNSNITFDTSGTNYTFTPSNGNIRVSYSVSGGNWWNPTTTYYYLRQSNGTTVQNSTTDDRNTWTVYEVTYDMP